MDKIKDLRGWVSVGAVETLIPMVLGPDAASGGSIVPEAMGQQGPVRTSLP